MWQDVIIASTAFILGLILIPQVISSLRGQHVNLWTSGVTATGLTLIGIIMITMGLVVGPISYLLNAALWYIIFILGIKKWGTNSQ